MKSYFSGQDLDLHRRRLSLLVLILFLLVILVLVLVILDPAAESRLKDGMIPFSGSFISQADYGPDLDSNPLAPLDIRIIRDILKDRNVYTDLSLLESDYARILAVLKTPVPSVTPRFSPTPHSDLSPTASLSLSPSATATQAVTQTATASLSPSPSATPSPSPTASLTLSPTTRVYPTVTRRPMTSTPRPTLTRTATPTKTATPTATLNPLSLLLDLTPNPAAINEPGGQVMYTLKLENTVSFPLTLISLLDSRFGNLNGLGSCVTGVVINPGGTLTCTYPGVVTGNAGTRFVNQVTAVARDSLSRTITVADATVVTILDVQPSLGIVLLPGVTTILEPGEVVTYSLTLTNTAVEPLTLIALVDETFGDLDGQGNCAVPHSIAINTIYYCTFSGLVEGNAGDTFRNTVTVSAVDDEDNLTEPSASASITIIDALPEIHLALNPAATALPEPGGIMTYTLQVENSSVEAVAVDSLVDSQFGNLNGQGTCSTGVPIASGTVYSCVYTGTILGNAGEIFTNIVTVQAGDDEGNRTTEIVSTTVMLTDGSLSISHAASEGVLSLRDKNLPRLPSIILFDR